MRNFKRIAAIVLMIALIIGGNYGMSYLFCPYTTARYEIHKIEEGGIEQLIVGTSHGKAGIDPHTLTEATGLETFNLARGGEYPVDVLHLVREAAAHNSLKRVIYEVDPAYWEVKPNQIADYLIYYREMSWSMNKLSYFEDKMPNADYRTGLTGWYLNRNSIGAVPETVRIKQSDAYKQVELINQFQSAGQTYTERGWTAINHSDSDRKEEDIPTLWSGAGPREESMRAVDRLVQFCKEQEIELIFIILPVSDETWHKYQENYEAGAAYVTAYAEDHGVRILNYQGSEYDADFGPTDFYVDYDGHMYRETAAEFTLRLGLLALGQ